MSDCERVTAHTGEHGDIVVSVCERAERAEQERDALAAEVAHLREALRIGTELDNHHNAAVCPYCTPAVR